MLLHPAVPFAVTALLHLQKGVSLSYEGALFVTQSVLMLMPSLGQSKNKTKKMERNIC